MRDFERTQAGLDVALKSTGRNGTGKAQKNATAISGTTEPGPSQQTTTGSELVLASESSGSKRKFELDEDDIERTARADKTRARRALDDEKVRGSW